MRCDQSTGVTSVSNAFRDHGGLKEIVSITKGKPTAAGQICLLLLWCHDSQQILHQMINKFIRNELINISAGLRSPPIL